MGEIPASIQVKLLTVLQERSFERVGGNESIKVDVRIIAATNRDRGGRGRGEISRGPLYRLNVVHAEMPALRLRGTDILVLAEHFLRRFALEDHRAIQGFTDRARMKLRGHRWPGNVRELENAIERAVVLCESAMSDEGHLPYGSSPAGGLDGIAVPGATLAELVRYAILKTLDAVGGSTVRAAELLDISARTIQYRLHEYGVAKERDSNTRSTERPAPR